MQVSNVKGGSRQSKRQEIRRKAHFELDSINNSGVHCSSRHLFVATVIPDSIKTLFGAITTNRSCAFSIVHINKLVLEYSNEFKLETLNLLSVDIVSGCKCSLDGRQSPLLLDVLFPISSLCLKDYAASTDSDYIGLLSYAIHLRRDVIVSALLRACVNPFTFNVSLDGPISQFNDEESPVIPSIHQIVADYRRSTTLTAFIWLMYQIDRLKCRAANEIISSGCSLCGQCSHQTDSFVNLTRCQHCVCLVCLWTNVKVFAGESSGNGSEVMDYYTYDVNSLLQDCLHCPVCRVAVSEDDSKSKGFTIAEDCQLNKEASLQKWLDLPESMTSEPATDDTNNTSSSSSEKLKFRALSPSQSAYYSIGHSRSQRTIQLFKCVVENNPRRLLALMDSGVCLDLVNHYHMTALCVAVMLGHSEVVIALLRGGADVFLNNAAQGSGKAVSSGGCYLLDIARHFHFGHIEMILLQYLQVHCGGLKVAALDHTLGTGLLINEHSTIRWLIPSSAMVSCVKKDSSVVHKPHPGAGRSFIIDSVFSIEFIDRIMHTFAGLPVASKVKESCSDRTYYCDILGQLTSAIEEAVRLMLNRSADANDGNACSEFCSEFCSDKTVEIFPSMKLLNYSTEGGISSPHIDLNKTSILTQHHSTYTFILYTSDCDLGGQTVLLRSVKEAWTLATDEPISENVLACVAPRRGRLLVFPHSCPHAGLATIDTPKTLLRGEILIE